MYKYMFILRKTADKLITVCPACAKRGEVVDDCKTCHGRGIKKKSIDQYYVQDRPIEITHIDRDIKTGILRYWENASEFFYETTTKELNDYVPDVPYGIHFCHDSWQSAKAECERINKYLKDVAKASNKPESFTQTLFSF